MTTKQPIAYMSRIEKFSAAHRLHSSMLSAEQNQEIFSKCNNANGHGHNYTVEVTVKGPIDPTTGMVINLVDLKTAMQKSILDVMDHRHLDLDVLYFKVNKIVSTTENVAVFIWKQLSEHISEDLLHEVKVSETDKNIMIYRGEYVE